MSKEAYLEFQRGLFRTERFAYMEDDGGRPKIG
jgi:hypothetical protein